MPLGNKTICLDETPRANTATAAENETPGTSTMCRKDKGKAKTPAVKIEDAEDDIQAIINSMPDFDTTGMSYDEKKKTEEKAGIVSMAYAIGEGIARSQTRAKSLNPDRPRSKIPKPESYDGKRGPGAKQFMLRCKAYFQANLDSFMTDESRMTFVLMTLGDGMPDRWGQFYL